MQFDLITRNDFENFTAKFLNILRSEIQSVQKHEESALPQFFTNSQMMQILNVSYNTLTKLRIEGLPHYKLSNGTLRYDAKEVESWIANRRIVSMEKIK